MYSFSPESDTPYGPVPTSPEVASAGRPSGDEEQLQAPLTVVLASETRRVVMRLIGGGELELGRTTGREAAMQLARDVVAHVEAAGGRSEWPELGERFVRPGAIVSIDVVRGE